MVWLPRQRRFVVAGMRFDWVGAKTGPAERVSCILRFDRVLKVSRLGLATPDTQKRLNLLAVTFQKTDPPAGMIVLAFADGALVRLEVECVEVELCDLELRAPAESCAGHALSRPGDGLTEMAAELDMADAGFEQRFAALLGAKREQAADVDAAVAAIIDDVRARGDAALVDYSLAVRPGRHRRARDRDRRGGDRRGGRRLRRRGAEGARTRPRAGDRPTTSARSRPIYASPTRSASSSAGAGGRSTRSGSMCPAARQAIPRRSS